MNTWPTTHLLGGREPIRIITMGPITVHRLPGDKFLIHLTEKETTTKETQTDGIGGSESGSETPVQDEPVAGDTKKQPPTSFSLRMALRLVEQQPPVATPGPSSAAIQFLEMPNMTVTSGDLEGPPQPPQGHLRALLAAGSDKSKDKEKQGEQEDDEVQVLVHRVHKRPGATNKATNKVETTQAVVHAPTSSTKESPQLSAEYIR